MYKLIKKYVAFILLVSIGIAAGCTATKITAVMPMLTSKIRATSFFINLYIPFLTSFHPVGILYCDCYRIETALLRLCYELRKAFLRKAKNIMAMDMSL